jgi:serine/threonine-protein kinase RsbT
MASKTSERVQGALCALANPIVARGVLRYALHQCGLTEDNLDHHNLTPEFVEELERGLRVMCGDGNTEALGHRALRVLLCPQSSRTRPSARVQTTRRDAPDGAETSSTPQRQAQKETIDIREEVDIVRARGRARGFAEAVGFGPTDQTKIATAVSEVSRNILVYAREGTVSLLPLIAKRGIRIEARDRGPGITDLDGILAGGYHSKTGMGLGLRGCRRLMDRFEVETGRNKGTVVIMEKEIA